MTWGLQEALKSDMPIGQPRAREIFISACNESGPPIAEYFPMRI
jgi:hypothetical protein